MKFLVDAQLPRRIARRLREAGYDTVHTLDLPAGNRTSDADIVELAIREDRIVVTKDADFVSSFIVTRRPKKLLLISTGNITNDGLEAILLPNLDSIVTSFVRHSFVELTRTSIIVHT